MQNAHVLTGIAFISMTKEKTFPQKAPHSIELQVPTAEMGAAVARLIADCPPLDTNSTYCNLLQCSHFAQTSVAAFMAGELVGFISGYRVPQQPDTLFVWQVAVSARARGQNLATRMLKHLLARPGNQDLLRVETTITAANRASWSLFRGLARRLEAPLASRPIFERQRHFAGQHDTEMLVSIGPFKPRRLSTVTDIGASVLKKQQGRTMTIFEQIESSVQSYARAFPRVFGKAQGEYLYDDQGRRYLDFLAGAGTLNYGHNHPAFKTALMDYISRDGITHGLDMHTEAKAAFLEQLQQAILQPRKLDYKVQFTGPTGANAVEAAIKLARMVTGRHSIVAFTNGFHGVTLGALAATGNQHHRGAAASQLNGVTRIPYDGYLGPDIDTTRYLDKLLCDASSGVDMPAAVLVETVQGEGGINAASLDWLRNLQRLCHKHGILLIVDDIQAGCGRTGSFFSFESAGLYPDMVTLSKSLSGYGLPMALVLIKPELDQWKPGEHNGTFRGNNLAFVTARAAIETFWRDDSFTQSIQRKAAYLDERIQQIIRLQGDGRFSAKGRGMFRGIDCVSGEITSQITRRCFEQGLIIETSGADDQVVKFLCPLTVSDDALQAGIDIVEQSIAQVCAGIDSLPQARDFFKPRAKAI